MVPPPLLRKPKLKQGDQTYLNAYYACDHGRQSVAMGGVNPIPVAEVRHYTDMAGIDCPGERLKYLRIIQRLDSVYIEHVTEKLKAQNKKKP